MAPVACNDAELAAMLALPVMEGLKIVGEQYLEPKIEQVIDMHTHRGSMYVAGQGGSLSRAWSTKTSVGGGFNLGTMETYYDSSKLAHTDSIRGQHMTPLEIVRFSDVEGETYQAVGFQENVSDMATLIDKGLGGMLLGPDNPTRIPTGFWDYGVIPQFKSNQRDWITAGLTAAGLTVM